MGGGYTFCFCPFLLISYFLSDFVVLANLSENFSRFGLVFDFITHRYCKPNDRWKLLKSEHLRKPSKIWSYSGSVLPLPLQFPWVWNLWATSATQGYSGLTKSIIQGFYSNSFPPILETVEFILSGWSSNFLKSIWIEALSWASKMQMHSLVAPIASFTTPMEIKFFTGYNPLQTRLD